MPPISRRDFLNGMALAIATGLTLGAQLATAAARYPPVLTGLRGQHPGSFEVAHALARAGMNFHTDDVSIEQRYDLVVVGGGTSGLAAAWFYRRAAGPDARILILDNCDDFGRRSDGLKPFLFRGALDDFGAVLETRSIGEQDSCNHESDQTEPGPDVL